jgi:ribosomal-protein-alanine N-acetyltransferase
VTENDTDDLHRLLTDPVIRKYLWDDQIIPRETVVEVIEGSRFTFEEHGFGMWAVSSKDDPGLIGFCGLRYFEDGQSGKPEVEILYGILPEHCGKGLATEAAKAVLKYGFEEKKLAQIYAGADPPNTASFRVMEKINMQYSRRVAINDVDTIYYVVQREDFQASE